MPRLSVSSSCPFFCILCKVSHSLLVAITVFVFIGTVPCYAGRKDSLQSLINISGKLDTNRVNLLIALGATMHNDDPDSMILLNHQAVDLAKQIGFTHGLAKAYQQLGVAYLRTNQYDSSLSSYHKSFDAYAMMASLSGQSAALLSIADIYYRQARYNEAMDYYNKGKALAVKANNMRHIGMALISIGGIYSDLGNYSEAIKAYLEGLSAFEKMSDKEGISMSLTNIATVYSSIGDYKKALDYINRSMANEEHNGNNDGVLLNVVNAGIVYGQMKNNEEALKYFNRGLALADSIGDRAWISVCRADRAEIYYDMGRYDEALVDYKAALADSNANMEVSNFIMCYSGIGNILLEKGNIREGLSNLERAYAIARKSNAKKSIFDLAGILSSAYEKHNDYKRSLYYHQVYFDYRDSVFNEKSEHRIQQLQFDYELDKKQKEIELLNKNKAIAHARSQKQEIVVFALIGGLALLVIIIAQLYRRRASERRSSQEISQQKDEIEQQARELEQLNQFKDKVFSVLSHDLRGPINSMTLSVQMLNSNELSPEEFDQIRPEITRQLGSLNALLENVLSWSSSHMQDHIVARRERASIFHLCTENVTMMQEAADRKSIQLLNNVPESAYANCDSGQINIVIRNLLMNAVKYTHTGGRIVLSAERTGHLIMLSVEDTGIGMTAEQINKLFTPAAGANTYGTLGEKGIGLGLLLAYEFVKANDGSLAVSSEPGKGTTFTLTLPA